MPSTINVLLVDEDTDVLELTQTFIEREDDGFDVTTETSATGALDRLENGHDYDCVVSDYSMPSMTGIEFLDAVRDRDVDLPFFLFTGRDRREIDAESEAVGVAPTGYVQKGTGTERYTELADEIRDAVRE